MLSVNQVQVIKEQAFAGFPSELPGVCKVHPCKVGDMIAMGSNNYSSKLGLLLLTTADIKKMIKDKGLDTNLIKDLTVLSYILKSTEENDTFLLEVQNAFATFIKEEILLLPKINAVLIGPISERRMITEENFEDFQTILNIQNRREIPEPPPENESEIARKMRIARETRDAVKRKQQKKDGEGQDLIDLLEIAEVYGIDYKERSIYAFYGLLQRHQLKEKWTQDIQMLCAGADSKKIKAKYWGEKPD